MKLALHILSLLFMFIVVICTLLILSTYPTMLLWNWLMPFIFGLPILNFWQTMGLLVLTSFLFRGGGFNGSSKK